MAHLNNVLKAVETLNALRDSDVSSDPGARYVNNKRPMTGNCQCYSTRINFCIFECDRKEKTSCCTIIVEGICSPTVRQNPKFPQILAATIETLLALCNDRESNVRTVADESLNKIIRVQLYFFFHS